MASIIHIVALHSKSKKKWVVGSVVATPAEQLATNEYSKSIHRPC